MKINEKTLFFLTIFCILLPSCNYEKKSEKDKSCLSSKCLTFNIEELIYSQEKKHFALPSTPEQGSITIKIPEKWLLNSTRLFEVRIFRNSAEGDRKIEIGKVMNVTLNADPDEFKIVSQPQDLSEEISKQSFASWSWSLKPKKSGCLYLGIEVDIKGKEFGQKVYTHALPIQIEPLPFCEGIKYFIDTQFTRLIALGSLIIAILTTISQWVPRFKTSRRVRKRLDSIEKSIAEIATARKNNT